MRKLLLLLTMLFTTLNAAEEVHGVEVVKGGSLKEAILRKLDRLDKSHSKGELTKSQLTDAQKELLRLLKKVEKAKAELEAVKAKGRKAEKKASVELAEARAARKARESRQSKWVRFRDKTYNSLKKRERKLREVRDKVAQACREEAARLKISVTKRRADLMEFVLSN